MCIMTTKPDPCVKDDGTVCKGILDGSLMGVPDEDGEALDFLYDSNYVTMGGAKDSLSDFDRHIAISTLG